MPSDDFWADLPDRVKKRPTKRLIVTDMPDPKAEPTSSSKAEIKVHDLDDAPSFSLLRLMGVVILMVVSALVGVGLVLYQGLVTPVDAAASDAELFEITKGQRTEEIINRLEDEGLIVSRYPLLAYITVKNLKIRAGVYSISPGLSPKEIADHVSAGDVSEHQVTIPEGWRIEQVGALFEKSGIVSQAEFIAAARYDAVRYTLPAGISLEPGDSLEGLLFPDTYRFAYGVTSGEIIETMLANFETRTKELKPTQEQIILASIIEREAREDKDRPQIAGVYRNRLDNNMKLQADPTVQYAKDSQTFSKSGDASFSWWQAITIDDYDKIESAYSTYQHSGLPPAPIANPGLKAIAAAVSPASHDYYYFLTPTDGPTVYSKTLNEHNDAKKKHL